MELLICYIFVYFIEALIIWQYCSNLFNPKHSRLHEGILLFCLYTGLLFVSFAEYPWLNIITFLIANFHFILIMYQVKWYSALFHSSISTIIMGMSELTVFSVMSNFAPVFYAHRKYFRNLIILIVFSKIIYFLIIYTLSHLLKEDSRNNIQHDKTSIFLTSVPIVSIYVMITLFAICENAELSLSLDWMISISAILMLVINLIIFAINIYNQRKNADYTEMQLLLQKENYSAAYYKMLLQQSENQSILIHDIKKHLHSIALLNEQGETRKISDYIERIIHSSDLQDNVHICDHEMLNSIICRYKKQCQENNIEFRTDIRSGTANFLNDDDLTSLFCNLLDNAVESASLMPNAFIELNLNNQKNTPYTILTMSNSCRKNPFSPDTGHLVSSKLDKSKHGFGMKSVRRIVKRYMGNIQIYYDMETTSFHTIITLKRA